MIQDAMRRVGRINRIEADIWQRYGESGKAAKKLGKLEHKKKEILDEVLPLTAGASPRR
jgi:hypothetical protein